MLRTILMSLALPACSIAFMGKPPKSGTCTRSKVPAIVDASIAAGAGVGAVTAFAVMNDSSDNRNVLVGVLLIAAVLEMGAADSGFETVGECRGRK
jgi:hypothetical protein